MNEKKEIEVIDARCELDDEDVNEVAGGLSLNQLSKKSPVKSPKPGKKIRKVNER